MVTRHARAYARELKDKIPEDKRPHARRTANMGLKGRPLRVAITASAVTGFSLFGYDQGLMSSIISSDQFTTNEFPILKREPSTEYSKINNVLQGGTTACFELGCFFGALIVLAVGEPVGRKPLIMFGMFLFVIGALISCTAFGPGSPRGDHWGLGQFIVGRVICGFGNGFATATIPVWQSEMARPERRGLLVQMEGSVVAIGTMIAYWFDFGLSFINTSIAWRFPVALQILFALCVLLATAGLPESSRWLVAKGRHDEARTVISHVLNLPEDHPDVEEMLADQQFDAAATGNPVEFKDLFTRGKTAYLQRMLIGASCQAYQQLSGCNAAIYYATVLFEHIFADSGQSERAQRVLSLILGGAFSSTYALFTFPAYYLVDGLGRRNLFFLGISGQAASFWITMGCLAASAAKTGGLSAKGDVARPLNVSDSVRKRVIQNEKGAAVGLFLFIAFFGCSILGLPWIYPPEINPLKTRTYATAVSTCSNWLFNFAVVMFTPVFINFKDWSCYLFFAIINMTWLPVVFFFYPETSGRLLEEIDVIFARAHEENKAPWRIAYSMPKLSREEVRAEVYRLGLASPEDDMNPHYGPAPPKSESSDEDAPRRKSVTSSISALSTDAPAAAGETPAAETPAAETPAAEEPVDETPKTTEEA